MPVERWLATGRKNFGDIFVETKDWADGGDVLIAPHVRV
jgi:hypothetical protein